MKKASIIIISIFLLLLSCTVNETTGVIRVKNSTHLPLTNIYVGETLIISSLASGSVYDYWYSFQIDGKLRSEGQIPISEDKEENTYHLKPGYWVFLNATYDHDGDEVLDISVKKHGVEYNETDADDYMD